ncbi:MAG: hypothetical protein QNJ47_10600 [Nostocaceae cyanobacterium]|nr:hypothetical protein [Nostocaceae cyanobacterium]
MHYNDLELKFLPEHLRNGQIIDIPDIVKNLDAANETLKTKPFEYPIQSLTEFNPFVKEGERLRETNFNACHDLREKLDIQLNNAFYFNSENVDLSDSDAQSIVEAAHDFLCPRDHNRLWLLPAFVERESIAHVATYHQSLLPRNRVIVVSPDQKTLAAAAPHCDIVINQSQVLECININALREEGFLPRHRNVCLSGKGTTLLAGFIWAMAHELINDETYVGHTDTDEINLDFSGSYYQTGSKERLHVSPYRPAEYMAAAAAYMPSSHKVSVVQPAKAGVRRKGEVCLPTWMMMANTIIGDAKMRQMGLELCRVAWPSPGEAIVCASVYRDMPWQGTTGFDLDRYAKAFYMEMGFSKLSSKESYAFVQVGIPAPKIESYGVRETDDIGQAIWATSIYSTQEQFYYHQLRKEGSAEFAPGYSDNLIKAFNEQFAGVELRVPFTCPPDILQNDYGKLYIESEYSDPNRAMYCAGPFYYPSPTRMLEMGIINLDKVREVPNLSTSANKSPHRLGY